MADSGTSGPIDSEGLAPSSGTIPTVPYENPFKSLLLRFQRGHAEHGQAMLILELLTEDEVEEHEEWNPPSLLDVDGYLSWDDPETGEPLFVAARASGATGFRGEFRDNLYDRAKEAWEVFKPLAREAGSHLPSSLRKAMPVEPHDAPGIWYTFLFWCSDHRDFEPMVTPKGHKYISRKLSYSVFLDSATAIETCRLNTSDPVLPPVLLDPQKHGTIPPMSQLKYNILQAMLELGAITADERRTTDKIAEKAEGSDANPNKFKVPLVELKNDSYVESKEGRGGGFWLTDNGKAVAEKL